MKNVRCLIRSDFPQMYDIWDEIRQSLGYETITDMMWCLWIEDEHVTLKKLSDRLGFFNKSVRRILKLMGIYERVDVYRNATMWRHHERAIKAGYKTMTVWIHHLKKRRFPDKRIYETVGMDRRTYIKYYT